MMPFKNILCHYSKPNGTAVLQRAVRLAKETHARLTVVEVIPALPDVYPIAVPPASGMTLADLYQATLQQSREHLEQLIKPWHHKSLTMEIKLLTGTPFLEIIKKVLRDQHDLVMTSVMTKSKARSKLTGTTALRLIRKCPCPVWVVTDAHDHPYRQIMAAVDMEPRQKGKQTINHRILTMAAAMADLEKSTLTVAHCWGRYPEWLLGFDYVDVPPVQLTQILEQTQRVHQQWLDGFMKSLRLPSGKVRPKLLSGDPGEELPKQARKEKVDLLVLGTVTHTGLSGFLMGHTAEKVLNEIHCSLLALKPKGFKSPVRL